MVNRRPNWDLVNIYADEGISGTSLQHRDSFVQMIEDCKAGKIELIVTKSVSRFARNIIDCIGYARRLKAMTPPVGIFFETENLYTLDPKSEMLLAFMATLAQEESHNKSEIMNASIEMRFKRGIFLTPPLLGYDQDEEGDLVINENEAKVVKFIFYEYLNGCSCQTIADLLTQLHCRTKKGNYHWNAGSISQILQNERYCGDVLARKTFTPNYLDHKAKKNKRDRNQYLQENHHENIISRSDFIAVQHKIMNSKYGTQKFLPNLDAIKSGLLKGFVLINTKWAGFSVDDYIAASKKVERSIQVQEETSEEHLPDEGEYDLRGFEIIRAQFISIANRISIRITPNYLFFSLEAINKFPEKTFIQMYIDPIERLLAIRPCRKEDKYSVQWARKADGKYIGRQIASSAFLPVLYELMGWDIKCKYKCIGNLKTAKDQKVIIFSLSDFEVLIPKESLQDQLNEENAISNSGKKNIVAYPKEWSDTFGTAIYDHPFEKDAILLSEDKNIETESVEYKNVELDITEPEAVNNEINNLITYFEEERNGNAIGK